MELSQVRKHKRKKMQFLPQMVVDNPMVILGLDLPFVVVSANSLKNAVALSIEMLFIHFVTMLVAWYIAPKLKVWQRVFVTSTVSVIMMALSRELVIKLIPDIQNVAGMYLYLIAVNGLTLIQANFLSPKAKLSEVVKTSLWNILGFAAMMGGVSFIREYVGNGTLWGKTVPYLVKLNGVQAPFFGFIFVGFLLAIIRVITKQVNGFYILETRRRSEAQQASEQPTK